MTVIAFLVFFKEDCRSKIKIFIHKDQEKNKPREGKGMRVTEFIS